MRKQFEPVIKLRFKVMRHGKLANIVVACTLADVYHMIQTLKSIPRENKLVPLNRIK